MKLSWLNGLLAISLSLGFAASAFAESVNVPGPKNQPASSSRRVSANNAPGHHNAQKPNPNTRRTYVNGRYVVNDHNSHKRVVSSRHYVKNVTPAPAPVVVVPPPVPAPAPVVVVPPPAPAPAPVVVVREPAPAPVVVAPAPAPVVVVPPPAPAPVVVAPAPAPRPIGPAPAPRPMGPAPAPRPVGPGAGPVGPGHHNSCGRCDDIRRTCRGPECNSRFDRCMRDCRR